MQPQSGHRRVSCRTVSPDVAMIAPICRRKVQANQHPALPSRRSARYPPGRVRSKDQMLCEPSNRRSRGTSFRFSRYNVDGTYQERTRDVARRLRRNLLWQGAKATPMRRARWSDQDAARCFTVHLVHVAEHIRPEIDHRPSARTDGSVCYVNSSSRSADSLAGVKGGPTSLDDAIAYWERSLRARNRSPRTIRSYLDAARLLLAFLDENVLPTAVGAVLPEHLEMFIDDQLKRWRPATAANRYRSLQQFFGWLVSQGEIPVSPIVRMRPPRVPEQLVPVVGDGDLRVLLKSCDGVDFEDIRDAALLRVMIETGVRLSEATRPHDNRCRP